MSTLNEPKRPYYQPKPTRPKPAIVIPVVDWTIARVLFWKGQKKQR